MKVLVAHSCPTLCDPMDCSPPGSSVRGILQARILEWVAMPSSGDSMIIYSIKNSGKRKNIELINSNFRAT